MSETKTPRTDKQVFPKGAYGQQAVSADFARQLEAENAALKSRVAELEKLAKDVLERFILLYEGKDRMSAHARKNEVDRWKMILEKGNHENKH